MPEKGLTKTQKRLLKLFKDIQDEDIEIVIIEVIGIEAKHRSAHNFPIRKIRDVIDAVARKQESAVPEGDTL